MNFSPPGSFQMSHTHSLRAFRYFFFFLTALILFKLSSTVFPSPTDNMTSRRIINDETVQGVVLTDLPTCGDVDIYGTLSLHPYIAFLDDYGKLRKAVFAMLKCFHSDKINGAAL
jgi:hypothetical protein